MKEKNELNKTTTSDSFLESKVDILRCISSLSNDEVFTPPHLVNEVLDLLPEEIWRDKNTTFLDPCCKTGVFLREITKRLIVGLEDEIPDLQERINHILTKQVFGLAITELTALVSRRTVYCSKDANSKYSICTSFGNQENHDICYKAEDVKPNEYYRVVEHEGQYYYYPQEHEGNILYPRTEHEWKNGACVKCGASQKIQDRGSELESHAYSFIHTDIKELFGDMKFDVIIGNPPYQLSDSDANFGASPLYHKFVYQAKKLNPKFISMIIPSRWTITGKGLDEFRREMLNDKRLKKVVDYYDSEACFNNVQIGGGVCYFLWDNNYSGDCEITTINQKGVKTSVRPLLDSQFSYFIRDNNAVSIIKKIQLFKEESFAEQVSVSRPFGFRTYFKGNEIKSNIDDVTIYVRGGIGYVPRGDVSKNIELIDKHKVLITRVYGDGGKTCPNQVVNRPFVAPSNTCCSETYLVLGAYDSIEEATHACQYIQTKFCRFLISLLKITQDSSSKVYTFVPMQDFSKSWTDEELYKKYNLTDDEINYIESMIKPMDL